MKLIYFLLRSSLYLTGLLSLCFVLLTGLTGCQTEKKPSILVIAVDRLSFNSFACSDERSDFSSGLTVLCREALRFTHAYTTSTQSAAAVGSVLTGLYPYQHQLHRSFDRIDYKATQIQSLADRQGYRTAFWSGGPTILRKTGLSKDFDIFDDSSFLEKKNYFSDLRSQTNIFLNWVSDNRAPYFAVIHNSELESLNEGESEISASEKADETLGQFFSELKKRGLWENNYIVVTGLQGQSIYNRLRETPFSNLHSENTNVLLFVKPPRQKGDEGINWKIDSALTLADLGYSLMKTIAPDYQNPIDLQFPVWDFSYLWRPAGAGKTPLAAEPLNSAARHLLIEATNTWQSRLETRFAVYFKNLVYLEDEKDEVYNILTDGLETINLSSSQKDFVIDNQQELTLIRNQRNLNKWTEFLPAQYNWVLANREYWSKPNNRLSVLENELKKLSESEIGNPLAALAVRTLLRKDQILDGSANLPAPEKELLLTDARRHSLNLSLENIWGIWSPDKQWLQLDLIKEYQ